MRTRIAFAIVFFRVVFTQSKTEAPFLAGCGKGHLSQKQQCLVGIREGKINLQFGKKRCIAACFLRIKISKGGNLCVSYGRHLKKRLRTVEVEGIVPLVKIAQALLLENGDIEAVPFFFILRGAGALSNGLQKLE